MKPILFNTEMVRALLADRKQMTRRVVKEPYYIDDEEASRVSGLAIHRGTNITDGMPYPDQIYRPGDILYVREAFFKDAGRYMYKADYSDSEKFYRNGKEVSIKWCPSIHMPREAARIFLWVADLRVERLQDSFCRQGSAILLLQREGIDIGEQCRDCINAYGSPCCSDDDSECGVLDEVRGEFSDLWDSTIKPADRDLYGWAANPWVWVITFERISREEAGL